MDLVDLIVAVHDQLDRAAIGHAFGGALALAYIAEPRGTVDIDVNAFVPVSEVATVAGALATLAYVAEPGTGVPPGAGHRFRSELHPFPIDVFCDLDDRYASVAARVQHHPFGRRDDVLPFLSAEDLCVFKLSFGRPQDWVDLEKIALARRDLELAYIEDQLVALRGPDMHRRLARFRSFLRRRPPA
jgi:hypothetical protein